MGNNLLKELALKIKLSRLDDERTKKDLKFIHHIVSTTFTHDKCFKNEKEKQKFISRYTLTERQYNELVGLYYFVRNKARLSERDFTIMLNSQFIKRFYFIREVRHYIVNLLDKISVGGPLDIALTYLQELKKYDDIRETREKYLNEIK